jgi:hypothetical protein
MPLFFLQITFRNFDSSIVNSYRKIQQDATVYQNLLFHIYMKLDMFRATRYYVKPEAASAVLGS